MFKKLTLFMIVLFTGIGLSWGADGRTLFNTKCLQCHVADSPAGLVQPIDKVSSQWRRFFKRNKHERKQSIAQEFTEEELAAVTEYLIAHASDSPQPEVAGQK